MMQILPMLSWASVACAAAHLIKGRQSATPYAYISSGDGVYQLSSWTAPVLGTPSPNGESTWALNVDDTSAGYMQQIIGFGACVTDATVAVFSSLSSTTLQQLLNELLTTTGADFSLLRHTIASSDLSADPAYSYDDAGGQPDPNMYNFNLGGRGKEMASLLATMKGVNPAAQILGSSWSAPGWMKLNHVLTGTTVNNNLNDSYGSAFAQYFVDYLQAYESQGAHIDAITIQNEPLNSRAGYPTMYVFADDSASLIQNYVGPALQNAGLSTQIWAYDHNTDEPDYPATVLNGASEYVNTVAWHCYAKPIDWTVLTRFHNDYPNAQQYMTECWTSQDYTTWSQAADFTIGPLQNWASGAMAWTLASDTNDGPHLANQDACQDCRGLVVVDTSAGTYSFTVDYYMMAQFSRFMPRGATVLSSSGSWTYADGTGVQFVASMNPDGTRTVVIVNKIKNDLYITLNTQSGQQWSGNVYQNSTVTWVLPPV